MDDAIPATESWLQKFILNNEKNIETHMGLYYCIQQWFPCRVCCCAIKSSDASHKEPTAVRVLACLRSYYSYNVNNLLLTFTFRCILRFIEFKVLSSLQWLFQQNQVSNSVSMHTSPVFGDHISSVWKNSLRWGWGAHPAARTFWARRDKSGNRCAVDFHQWSGLEKVVFSTSEKNNPCRHFV